MIPPKFQSKLHSLDSIQSQIFKLIDVLVKESNETFPESKAAIVKEITQHLMEFEQLITAVEVDAQNYKNPKVDAAVQIYKNKLPQLKVASREAQLQAYKLEEIQIHKQRVSSWRVPERPKLTEEMKQELFGKRLKKTVEESVEQQIMQQNQSITSSLKVTRDLMKTLILQTELNIGTLEQQTKDLSLFDSLLVELQTTLMKSKNIVKFIEKQDRHDKNRIYMSLGFLMLCCAWVIWRRILKTPVKILLWSFFKIFRVFLWFLPKKERDVFEIGGMSEVVSSVSTVMETIGSSLETMETGTMETMETFLNDEL